MDGDPKAHGTTRREFLTAGAALTAGTLGLVACSGGSSGPSSSRSRDVTDGVAVPGQFRSVGPDIIDPNGRKFLSLGANVAYRPVPTPDFWLDRAAANGKGADALEWGWNTIRLHSSVNTDGTGLSRAQIFDGVMQIIDEYTSQGIVVIPPSFDHQGSDPTFDELVASGVVDLQDALISTHGQNPYLWLNPLDEQTTREGLDTWTATGRALHDRAREQGFEGLFVWDLPQFGQGLELIATTSLGTDFAEATTNTAFGWHNFGAAEPDRQDQWAQQAIDLGLTVHIGGFGQGWDPTRPSVSDGWPTMDRDERRGADWVLTRFSKFGFGAVVWHGTGYIGGEDSLYSLRQGDNLPWYDFPDAPPLSDIGQQMYDLGQTLKS
jgi:hypothetical protein